MLDNRQKDYLMSEWARWRQQPKQAPNGLKPSALNIAMAGGISVPRLSYGSAVLTADCCADDVFARIDRLVCGLGIVPRSVVRTYYCSVGCDADKAESLGIARSTMFVHLRNAKEAVFADAKLCGLLRNV